MSGALPLRGIRKSDGAAIHEHIGELNQELEEEGNKSRSLKRFMEMSDKAYEEEVARREAETMAEVYSRLLRGGVIKPKKSSSIINSTTNKRRLEKAKIIEAKKKKPPLVQVAKSEKPKITIPVPIDGILVVEQNQVDPMPVPVIRPVQPKPITTAAPAAPAATPVVAKPVRSAEDIMAAKKKKEEELARENQLAEEREQARLEAERAAAALAEKEKETEVEEEEEDEETTEEETIEEVKMRIVYEILEKKGIDRETIESWKQVYGKNSIGTLIISEDEIYIFTHIRYENYKQILNIIKKEQDLEVKAELYDKLILRYGLIFPEPDELDLNSLRAGTPDALTRAISHRSGLLINQEALKTMTVQL